MIPLTLQIRRLPHSDGLPEPMQFAKALTAFDDGAVRKIMRDNLAGLLAS